MINTLIFASHRASSGDGPEVYAELLTKNLTPYVTTQVKRQHNPLLKVLFDLQTRVPTFVLSK